MWFIENTMGALFLCMAWDLGTNLEIDFLMQLKITVMTSYVSMIHWHYYTFGIIWLVVMCSTFSNIFDEPHFIKSLEEDVKIVKELPKELESLPRARKHFTSWAGLSYYEEMTGLWKEYQASYLHLFFMSLFGCPHRNIFLKSTRMRYRGSSVVLGWSGYLFGI